MLHQKPYRHPAVIAGLALAMVLAAIGIFGPMATPHDPYATRPGASFCPPLSCASGGASHLMGTDSVGRDTLTRFVVSLRTYVYIGLLGAALGLLTAWLLVMARGIRNAGPALDMPRPLFGVPLYALSILSYFIGVIVCISVFVVLGADLVATMVCAGVFSAPPPMALVYGSVRRDSMSSNPVRLAIRRGIALFPLGFSLALLMGLCIESSVSFLGMGVPPPSPSLGGLMNQGMVHYAEAPWILVLPLGIVLVSVAAFWAIVIPVGRGLVPIR